MTENGWQAIGRLAKARRERLGLNQDELAQYGGPRVATVGKFERAAQSNFPLRTQHQLEHALGWTRGTIENFVSAWDEEGADNADLVKQWQHDLVDDDIPDMGRPLVDETAAPMRAAMGPLAGSVQMLESVLRLLPNARLDDAVRDALLAILPHLDTAGATRLGRELRLAFPPEGGEHGGKAAPMNAAAEDDLYEDLAAYPQDEHGREVPDGKHGDR
jgi:transcriptional regulator with XRE-family HTH domain